MESDRKDLRVAFDFKLDLMVERLTERKKKEKETKTVLFRIFKAKFSTIIFCRHKSFTNLRKMNFYWCFQFFLSKLKINFFVNVNIMAGAAVKKD